MPRATAMVVLIASVCRPVIWSVTATAVMLPEVAVMAPSSPNQISSISSCIILVCPGSSKKTGNWSSMVSMPFGSLIRKRASSGSLSTSLSTNSCINSGSSSTPGEASRKSTSNSGSYLSPGSPESVVQSRTSASYDPWIGPAAAFGRRSSSSKAFVRSWRFRSVRVFVNSAFTSMVPSSVEPPTAASRVFMSSSTPPPRGRTSLMLNSESSPVDAYPKAAVTRSTPTRYGIG